VASNGAEPVNVLLIDDDPHTGAIFELLMEHFHMQACVVHNTASALEYLSENSPDIIVIDLFLPGTDGFQTLLEVRKRMVADCRILATTAYYTKDTEREVVRYGFDGYIPKPFVPDSFVAYLYGKVE
jgi:DNA-binding response OmpR family regulator